MTTTTPFMGLALPDDHGSADVWDTLLDAVFAKLDAHDHSPGNGALVPVAGLNINANVQLASAGVHYAMYDALAFDFFPSAPSAMTSFAGALFMSSVDSELYWRTAAGSNVKLTDGAALNIAQFAGGIGGDYSTAGALIYYDDSTHRYLLQQPGSPRPWAGLAGGNIDIYEQLASIAFRVRLQSPHALAASYALTLPAALPGSQALAQIDAAGNILASNTLAAGQHISRPAVGRVIPFVPGYHAVDSGSVLGVASCGAVSQQPSSVAYYPINELDQLEELESVRVNCTATGGSPTYTILEASNLNGAFSALSVDVTSAGSAVVVPVTLPGHGSFLALWLKVVTDGATTVTLANVTITTTVP